MILYLRRDTKGAGHSYQHINKPLIRGTAPFSSHRTCDTTHVMGVRKGLAKLSKIKLAFGFTQVFCEYPTTTDTIFTEITSQRGTLCNNKKSA